MRVSEIAAALGTAWEGEDGEIKGVAALAEAGPHSLAFVGNRKAMLAAAGSAAGCLLVPPDFNVEAGFARIRTKDPRGLFTRVIALFHQPVQHPFGSHATAVLMPGAHVHPTASIGPGAVIEAGAVVGAETRVGPQCWLGTGVTVGDGCTLHAAVRCYPGVVLGNRVVVHAGAVIGADGFGFAPVSGRWVKFPQIGGVVVGDDVEIGANACIDRGALGDTVIGEGTKLDNMVHVGHNCRIGKHVVVAAQTGFSGGVTIGDGAIIGGQVGVGDQARIEAGAVVGSGAGILPSKIVKAGTPVWGTPARPLKEYLELLAYFGKLPELAEEVKQLKARLELRDR